MYSPVEDEGVVPGDSERGERTDVVRQRLGIAEAFVQLLDLFDGEHGQRLLLTAGSCGLMVGMMMAAARR